MRGVHGLAVAVLGASLLAGCSPEKAGAAALYVTSDGTLMVQLAVCSGRIDGVTLWYAEGRGDHSTEHDVLNKELDAGATGPVTVSLGVLGGDSDQLDLDPRRTYEVLATSKDNSRSLSGPSFSTRDIEGLSDGGLLIPNENGDAEKSDESPDDWASKYCRDF